MISARDMVTVVADTYMLDIPVAAGTYGRVVRLLTRNYHNYVSIHVLSPAWTGPVCIMLDLADVELLTKNVVEHYR